MCSWKYFPLILKEDNGVVRYIYGDGKLARPAIIVNDCNFIGLRRRMFLAMNSYMMNSYMKLVQIAFKQDDMTRYARATRFGVTPQEDFVVPKLIPVITPQ